VPDLEGIVAKRKLGIYKDDGNNWIKIKNRTYSQAEPSIPDQTLCPRLGFIPSLKGVSLPTFTSQP
jgi:hypothetical protein